jgi:hypothetical protein
MRKARQRKRQAHRITSDGGEEVRRRWKTMMESSHCAGARGKEKAQEQWEEVRYDLGVELTLL